ncbi:MAG: hypothetical protein J6T10_06260 [Methanobrevibacter sp.]|nr:hypothetical protein [Methanobrevibacter sp.]
MVNKIRIYGLTVSHCVRIFEEQLFKISEFKEDETGDIFDIELAEIDAVSLHDNGVTIIANENEYFISRNEFKEIIII